ncbi:hypothetical protein [Mycoplasma phocoeninasale]|uniref:hypothetical protein n=1 Tax=Mycoplasma phocoeninasale TaxID=2726117 RepID=UPI001968631F|nr:hypothetical protein [Mycoplasma phocoeninasale]MBN0970656.1 hypothetical protein [Mycoplasma phocoeninasale]
MKNKKDLKAVNSAYLNDKNFLNSFSYINNSFVATLGFGNYKFNKLTIKLWAQALANELKGQNLKILIVHDGSNENFDSYTKSIANIFKANKMQPFMLFKQAPASKNFIKFILNKIDGINLVVYLSKYTYDSNYAISIFDNKGLPVAFKFLEKIVNRLDITSLGDINEFEDEANFLDFNKLLNEYVAEIVNYNHTESGNKLITIGIVYDNLSESFVKRIMGKNDIGYRFVKNKFTEDKPKVIYLPITAASKFKNINYIFKFSYDFQKLYIYKKQNRMSIMPKYELIDINELIANYLIFVNSILKTNKNSKTIHEIKSTLLTKNSLFETIAKKYDLSYNIGFFYENSLDTNNINLFFNENYEINFGFSQSRYGDAFLAASIFSDMFNYYETQHMKFDDLKNQNLIQIDDLLITNFSFNCDSKNLESFETKIFSQMTINQIEISRIEDLRENIFNKEKYLAKIHFEEHEWVGIKFSYELNRLLFICQENKKTKGNLAQNLRKYFAMTLRAYAKPIIPELDEEE